MASDRRLVAWCAATVVAFAALTALVVGGWEPLQSADDAVLDPVHDWAMDRSCVVRIAEFVDVALHPNIIRVVLVFAAVALWWQRLSRTAYWLFACVLGELVLIAATKVTVDRSRPEWENPLATAGGWAFPSGHTAGGALFAGALLVLAHLLVRSRPVRYALDAVGVGVALVLGLSRLILGVHYPSDILAGYLLVAALLCGIAIAFTSACAPADPAPRRRARPQ